MFDRQTVAVPTRYIMHLSSTDDVVPIDHVLEDLVERMTWVLAVGDATSLTHMKIAICVWRTVVQDEDVAIVLLIL